MQQSTPSPNCQYELRELLIGHFDLSGCYAELNADLPDSHPNLAGPAFQLDLFHFGPAIPNDIFEVEEEDFFKNPLNTKPCDMAFTCWAEPAAATLALDLGNGGSVPLLMNAEGRNQGDSRRRGFRTLAPDENTIFGYQSLFAFSDPDRVFFVAPILEEVDIDPIDRRSLSLASWRGPPSLESDSDRCRNAMALASIQAAQLAARRRDISLTLAM